MIECRVISAEETQSLRHLVLWPHLREEKDCVIEIDKRPDAIHLGAFENGNLVSILSLFAMTTPKLPMKCQYRLRAMATHPDYRNRGVGKLLVEHAQDIIRSMQFDVLWCDARKVALGFYEKLNFESLDEWYEVPKIGMHKLMYWTPGRSQQKSTP